MIGGYSPEAHEKPLHDYQVFAVEWQLERLYKRLDTGVGLFLDPGLGKTRITLTLLDYLFTFGEIKRALIVAPLRPIYTVWPAEIKRWGFPQSHVILHDQHARAMRSDCQIELINYEGFTKIKDIENRWDFLVLDESTLIKNWSRIRSKLSRKIAKTVPMHAILTGTPAANSLADLHSQMFIVDGGEALGRTVTYFRNRYMARGGYMGRQWILRDEMQDELLSRIHDKVLRMDAADYLDMPDLVENEVWCEMSTTASKQYKTLKKELCAQLETGEVFAASAAAAYSKCRQFANGTVYTQLENGDKESHVAHDRKVKALTGLMEELAGKPLLVFYHFSHDRDRLLKTPAFKGCPVIKGGMKIAAVEKILARWNDGKFRAILCQWQAASHGLNMQEACNDVACFGMTDSPEVYQQAYRRVYRQGVQGDQVRIHKILTRGTVDHVMLERLQGKHKTQDDFLEALKKHAKG